MHKGVYKLKCVKQGGCTLTAYGQYAFSENEELDLLDDAVPDTLRAGDYWTADNMCRDTGFEIAQRIEAGEFVIIEKVRPDPRELASPPTA